MVAKMGRVFKGKEFWRRQRDGWCAFLYFMGFALAALSMCSAACLFLEFCAVGALGLTDRWVYQNGWIIPVLLLAPLPLLIFLKSIGDETLWGKRRQKSEVK